MKPQQFGDKIAHARIAVWRCSHRRRKGLLAGFALGALG
jgi:hypothetical protein